MRACARTQRETVTFRGTNGRIRRFTEPRAGRWPSGRRPARPRIDRRHGRLREHRDRGGRDGPIRPAGDRARGSPGGVQRAVERPAGGVAPGQRRDVRVRVPLSHPTLGFTAGWMFLCAKSASAATAAAGLRRISARTSAYRRGGLDAVGLLAVLAVTALVWHGTCAVQQGQHGDREPDPGAA